MTEPMPRIALLAVPEVAASTLYGMFDLFCSAGRDWAGLVEGRAGDSLLAPRVVARGGARPLVIANGVQIVPQEGLDAIPEVVCVPEVAVAPDTRLNGIPLPYFSRAIILPALASYFRVPASSGGSAVNSLPHRWHRSFCK